jgi:hypothetical protein
MSIMYRTTMVKIVAWTKNPKSVGHPSLLEMAMKRENAEFTALYVHGLNRIKSTSVV